MKTGFSAAYTGTPREPMQAKDFSNDRKEIPTMKKYLTLALAMTLLAAFTGLSGAQLRAEDKKPVPIPARKEKVNPCANTRCQSGYHCVPLSQVGFCAKDQEAKCTVTCYGISADMSGSCSNYANQLANHPGCSCVD